MAETVKKFADDMPDCLPLPDKQEKFIADYKTFSLAVESSANISEAAASVFYLLGVYSGTNETGFFIKSKETWLPLKLDLMRIVRLNLQFATKIQRTLL